MIFNDWREQLKEQFFDYWHPVFADATEDQKQALEDFIDGLLKEEKEKTLDLIAADQGWEETRDKYAKWLGLETKY